MNRKIRWMTSPAVALVALASDTAAVMRRELRYRDVPAVEPHVGLISEALLDGGFSAMLSWLVGVPDSQDLRYGHRRLMALRDFLDQHGFLERPADYHETPPPLRDPQWAPNRLLGPGGRLEYEEMIFDSGYEPHSGEPGRESWLAQEDNGSGVAYVMRHADEDRPWFVCTHGFGLGQAGLTSAAFSARWVHKELGLNVMLPVLPLHGPRSATRWSGAALLRPDFSNVLHLIAQGVWDLRSMIGWIRSQSDQPIGLHGISLGAHVAALASSFVEDLACVVAGSPSADFASLARDNEPETYQAYGDDLQTDWALVQDVMHPVSPLAFEPRVSVERRYIYSGVADRVTRPDQARSLWRHWGRPEIAWTASGHMLAPMKSDVRSFLRRIAGRHLFEGRTAPFFRGEGAETSNASEIRETGEVEAYAGSDPRKSRRTDPSGGDSSQKLGS